MWPKTAADWARYDREQKQSNKSQPQFVEAGPEISAPGDTPKSPISAPQGFPWMMVISYVFGACYWSWFADPLRFDDTFTRALEETEDGIVGYRTVISSLIAPTRTLNVQRKFQASIRTWRQRLPRRCERCKTSKAWYHCTATLRTANCWLDWESTILTLWPRPWITQSDGKADRGEKARSNSCHDKGTRMGKK